jgi:hypothetical protein
LIHPKVYDPGKKRFRPSTGTHGYLVHRDRIERVRVLLRDDDPEPSTPEAPSPAPAM